MSIAARIQAVTIIAPYHCHVCNGTGSDPDDGWDDCPNCHGATASDPKVRLRLEPMRPGELAGQDTLTVVNPPSLDPEILSGLVGTEIWGGSSEIMVGETKWANRIGYTKIELVENLK